MEEERPKLEIFDEQIKFRNWLQVYAGIRHGWLSSMDVFRLIDRGLVACTEDRHADLYMALEKSRFAMLNLIKQYIREDMGVEIIHHEEDIDPNEFPYIPQSAWAIWELEFLLRIRNSGRTTDEKIYDIYLTWCDFKFLNVNWKGFLWIENTGTKEYPGPDGDVLYKTFLNYTDKLITELQ